MKKPETLTFQINAKDAGAKTQFKKLNEVIEGKKSFKIIKFEPKEAVNPKTGTTDDVSELTIEDTATHQKLVLILNRESSSPDSYAVFRYLVDNKDYPVKLGATFELPPDKKKYTLVDVNANGAIIQDEQGNKLPISKL